MERQNPEKNGHFYECKICDYKTSRKSSMTKHLSTPKHENMEKSCKLLNKKVVLEQKSCNLCGKTYKFRNSLWYHKKTCNYENVNYLEQQKVAKSEKCPKKCPKNYEEIMLGLLTQNIELQKQVIDLCKEKNITINSNNNNNNTTNNKFNMNFFLNEQCKGALDIMDFVSSLKVQLEDLENTGKIGYVKGISEIFLRGLRELDVYKRPIHCSDLKREVMYVKDKDVWEKDEEKKKVKRAILHIADKNFKQLNEWIKENPDSKDIETKKHEQYMRILSKCTGGIDNNEDDLFYKKIISNVAKEVHIDK
jgi:hypothetical protein